MRLVKITLTHPTRFKITQIIGNVVLWYAQRNRFLNINSASCTNLDMSYVNIELLHPGPRNIP